MNGNGAFINKKPLSPFSLQEVCNLQPRRQPSQVSNLQPRRQPSPEPNHAGSQILYSNLQICERYISAIYKSPVYRLPW